LIQGDSKNQVELLISRIVTILFYIHNTNVSIPSVQSANPGSWPSPVEEELNDQLSFDEWLNIDKASTFMVIMPSDVLKSDGVLRGDTLIVERGRPVQEGDLVVARADEAFVVRSWAVLCRQMDIQVLGVVVSVVRKLR